MKIIFCGAAKIVTGHARDADLQGLINWVKNGAHKIII